MRSVMIIDATLERNLEPAGLAAGQPFSANASGLGLDLARSRGATRHVPAR